MNTKESVLRKEYPAEEGLRPEGAIKDRYSISWPQKGISSRRRIKTHAPGPVCMLLLLRKEYPAEEGLRPFFASSKASWYSLRKEYPAEEGLRHTLLTFS